MTDRPRRARRDLETVRLEAQRLALAPFAFQATRALRDLGILAWLYENGPGTAAEVAEAVGLPRYGALVLLEMGLGANLVTLDEDRFDITPVGIFIDRDPMTRVNLDFSQDVNYRGLDHLQEAVTTMKPAGLVELSDEDTIYEALASLPEPVRKSWFAFDHFYSDAAFESALAWVLAKKPGRVMDVGANTGRFAKVLLSRDPDVAMTLVDHPGQLAEADATLVEAGLRDRATLHAMDLLDADAPLPGGADVIWLSQFLDCFGEDEIVSILTRAREALAPGGAVVILELLWDRQPSASGAYILQATSLYFTALASGNSRMYSAPALHALIERAGLSVAEEVDDLGGLGHTILRCVPS